MEARDILEISILASQFCCQSKTSIDKLKVLKKKQQKKTPVLEPQPSLVKLDYLISELRLCNF